jgi:hypothetical protein
VHSSLTEGPKPYFPSQIPATTARNKITCLAIILFLLKLFIPFFFAGTWFLLFSAIILYILFTTYIFRRRHGSVFGIFHCITRNEQQATKTAQF